MGTAQGWVFLGTMGVLVAGLLTTVFTQLAGLRAELRDMAKAVHDLEVGTVKGFAKVEQSVQSLSEALMRHIADGHSH